MKLLPWICCSFPGLRHRPVFDHLQFTVCKTGGHVNVYLSRQTEEGAQSILRPFLAVSIQTLESANVPEAENLPLVVEDNMHEM